MRKYGSSEIIDVEVLTCKRRNHYFSIKCYLEERSSYTHINLSDKYDKRITKRAPINECSSGKLSAQDYIATAQFIIDFVDKVRPV